MPQRRQSSGTPSSGRRVHWALASTYLEKRSASRPPLLDAPSNLGGSWPRRHARQHLLEVGDAPFDVSKELPNAAPEVLLTVDANTGQNAIRQVREFKAAVPVTGIVLTKLDGTAKGGVVLGIAQEVGVPVLWVGTGEGADDLQRFRPEEFVRELFTPLEEE